MRWKWLALKGSSMLLFTVGITAISIVFIGLGSDWQLLGMNDWLILGAIAIWALLVAFVYYVFVQSSQWLLQRSESRKSFRWQQNLLAALLLNLPVLAGWIFVGVVIVQAFGNAEPGAQIPSLVKLFAYLLLLNIVIAIGNYLLAINAWFEYQFMRRKHQEDILHSIGNPMLHKHP